MSFRYYKHPSHTCGEYYRVHPNDYYEYFPPTSTPTWGSPSPRWQRGVELTWTARWRSYSPKPIEVSELEILVVLGAEAVREV